MRHIFGGTFTSTHGYSAFAVDMLRGIEKKNASRVNVWITIRMGGTVAWSSGLMENLFSEIALARPEHGMTLSEHADGERRGATTGPERG